MVPFDLLAEFLPNDKRGIFLIYIEGFWTIGMCCVARVWSIVCMVIPFADHCPNA